MSFGNAGDRLDALEELLDDLIQANEATPVLVEGEKDEAALRALGLEGEILRVKGAATVFAVCENLARRHREVIVLVDWDRGGGRLAALLAEGLEANGVRHDGAYRRAFAQATKKEIVHVEGLAKYIGNLRIAARRESSRHPNV